MVPQPSPLSVLKPPSRAPAAVTTRPAEVAPRAEPPAVVRDTPGRSATASDPESKARRTCFPAPPTTACPGRVAGTTSVACRGARTPRTPPRGIARSMASSSPARDVTAWDGSLTGLLGAPRPTPGSPFASDSVSDSSDTPMGPGACADCERTGVDSAAVVSGLCSVGDGAGGGKDGDAAAAGGGAGSGWGAGAGGAAGAGGGWVALRDGSRASGSTYWSSPTRTPRWTYGTECSGSPEGPGWAIGSLSATLAPFLTSSGPRCVSETRYPSPVVMVTVSPCVGTAACEGDLAARGGSDDRCSP